MHIVREDHSIHNFNTMFSMSTLISNSLFDVGFAPSYIDMHTVTIPARKLCQMEYQSLYNVIMNL